MIGGQLRAEADLDLEIIIGGQLRAGDYLDLEIIIGGQLRAGADLDLYLDLEIIIGGQLRAEADLDLYLDLEIIIGGQLRAGAAPRGNIQAQVPEGDPQDLLDGQHHGDCAQRRQRSSRRGAYLSQGCNNASYEKICSEYLVTLLHMSFSIQYFDNIVIYLSSLLQWTFSSQNLYFRVFFLHLQFAWIMYALEFQVLFFSVKFDNDIIKKICLSNFYFNTSWTLTK